MQDIRLNRFAGTASILVGAGFVAFIILALLEMQAMMHSVLAVTSILAFVVVLGIARYAAGSLGGWILWASSLGLFGLALSAIIQTSLLVGLDREQLLPHMVLTISTVAAWVLITSLVALGDARWPHVWSLIGVALSLLWAGLIPAQQFGARMAGIGLSAAATILAAIWFIWAGVLLRGEGRPSSTHRPGGDRGAE